MGIRWNWHLKRKKEAIRGKSTGWSNQRFSNGKRAESYPWFHSAWMNGPTLRVAYIPYSPINLMNFTKSYCPSKLYCKNLEKYYNLGQKKQINNEHRHYLSLHWFMNIPENISLNYIETSMSGLLKDFRPHLQISTHEIISLICYDNNQKKIIIIKKKSIEQWLYYMRVTASVMDWSWNENLSFPINDQRPSIVNNTKLITHLIIVLCGGRS